MTQNDDEREVILARVREAIDKLDDKELWSTEKIKPIKDNETSEWAWMVEYELDTRRRAVTDHRASFWVKDYEDPNKRERMKRIESDFEMDLRRVKMKRVALDSPYCNIEEPIASYLAQPELQNSGVTRRFCWSLLAQLKDGLSYGQRNDVKIAKMILDFDWLLIPGLPLLGYIFSRISIASWPIIIGGLASAALAFRRDIKEAKRLAEADIILDRLIDRFRKFRGPVTFDGLVFTDDLGRLRRLGVGVPSLLFSLFRITSPES